MVKDRVTHRIDRQTPDVGLGAVCTIFDKEFKKWQEEIDYSG